MFVVQVTCNIQSKDFLLEVDNLIDVSPVFTIYNNNKHKEFDEL